MSAKTAAIETMSFEAALAELETIVRDLETGKAALDDSIASYERGVALENSFEKKLREAQMKIEKISVNRDGAVSAAPFGQQE